MSLARCRALVVAAILLAVWSSSGDAAGGGAGPSAHDAIVAFMLLGVAVGAVLITVLAGRHAATPGRGERWVASTLPSGFAADMAHELRTPLTALTLIGENALARHGVDAQPRDAIPAIASMLEECRHMGRLIDTLLVLARTTQRGVPVMRTPVDASLLARDCVLSLRVLAEEKQQDLRLHLPRPLFVPLDRVLMRQALLNVIHNAIAHCPPHTRIDVAAALDATGSLEIHIADDGPGIALGDQASVFDRFERCGKRPDRTGTGLGLAIAKASIEAHGGRIELRSFPGRGSRFTFLIPRHGQAATIRSVDDINHDRHRLVRT